MRARSWQVWGPAKGGIGFGLVCQGWDGVIGQVQWRGVGWHGHYAPPMSERCRTVLSCRRRRCRRGVGAKLSTVSDRHCSDSETVGRSSLVKLGLMGMAWRAGPERRDQAIRFVLSLVKEQGIQVQAGKWEATAVRLACLHSGGGAPA